MLSMTNAIDTLTETLGRSVEPNGKQIAAMAEYLSNLPGGSVTAVKALIAALCEVEAMDAATVLEGTLEALAASELAGM